MGVDGSGHKKPSLIDCGEELFNGRVRCTYRGCRRWCASWLGLAGADGAALMEWAGWADLRPAANYLHMAGKKAAEFSDKVQ